VVTKCPCASVALWPRTKTLVASVARFSMESRKIFSVLDLAPLYFISAVFRSARSSKITTWIQGTPCLRTQRLDDALVKIRSSTSDTPTEIAS
jgi:hypothetical protein